MISSQGLEEIEDKDKVENLEPVLFDMSMINNQGSIELEHCEDNLEDFGLVFELFDQIK